MNIDSAHGFATSGSETICWDELKALRRLADDMLAHDHKAREAAMRNATITEIKRHG